MVEISVRGRRINNETVKPEVEQAAKQYTQNRNHLISLLRTLPNSGIECDCKEEHHVIMNENEDDEEDLCLSCGGYTPSWS